MNHISQLNRLIPLVKRYTDFLPICPSNKLDALQAEINKIDLRIKTIYAMNVEQSLAKLAFSKKIQQSITNFINL